MPIKHYGKYLFIFIFIFLDLCKFEPQEQFLPSVGLFTTLNYPKIVTNRVKRSTSISFGRLDTYLTFNAFGKQFELMLHPDNSLFAEHAKLIVGDQKSPEAISASSVGAVKGYVNQQPNSLVIGSIIEGTFRGTIFISLPLNMTNKQNISDVFFVEPSGNIFNETKSFHSIIYRIEDDEMPVQLIRGRRNVNKNHAGFCGLSDVETCKKMQYSSKLSSIQIQDMRSFGSSDSFNANIDIPSISVWGNNFDQHFSSIPSPKSGASSTRRGPLHGELRDNGPMSRVCNLYLQSDTYLWDHVISLAHIRGNKDLAVKEITSILTQHVQGALAIYQHTTFIDPKKNIRFSGVSFRVDRVQINVTEEDCRRPPFRFRYPSRKTAQRSNAFQDISSPSPQSHLMREELTPLKHGSYDLHNPFCAENVDVTNYLNLNSYVSHDDFCLAYVFTYRDFLRGTLGLAWVAEPGGSGGICEKYRLMREGSHMVKKSLNTGVVTLLNYGSRVPLKVSQLTFAHEMGHSLGAKHDDDFKEDVPTCLPNIGDPKGNFIMFASATAGNKENNNKFSTCSTTSIARLLDHILRTNANCFLSSTGSFCGNKLTEENEQCDCGFSREDCDDVCCNPKDSLAPCNLTKSAVVQGTRYKVHCSPSAGECCTHTCQFRNSSNLCLPASECHASSYCSGSEPRCPVPISRPNGTPCQNRTRICKSGVCVGSICERIPGWHDCSLTRGEDVSLEMMCYVACAENRTGAPCISTIQMEKDVTLRKRYPKLAAELLRNGSGIRLSPGSPCDNYRGYCDVFMRCRSVQAEGPLARLRNLLFSPQVLSKIRIWITVHWWAMLLISFGVITAMILFMKLCSYHTPSTYNLMACVNEHRLYRHPLLSRLPHDPSVPHRTRSLHSSLPDRDLGNSRPPRSSNSRGRSLGQRNKRSAIHSRVTASNSGLSTTCGTLDANSPSITTADTPGTPSTEFALRHVPLRVVARGVASNSIHTLTGIHQRIPSFRICRRRLTPTCLQVRSDREHQDSLSEFIPSSNVFIPYRRDKRHLLKFGGTRQSRPFSTVFSCDSTTQRMCDQSLNNAVIPTLVQRPLSLIVQQTEGQNGENPTESQFQHLLPQSNTTLPCQGTPPPPYAQSQLGL